MLKKSFEFIRKNPTILSSLFLIVAVSAVVFFNAYYSLDKFQKNTDALLMSKAAFAGDVFEIVGGEQLSDWSLIQKRIEELKSRDDEVKAISIFEGVIEENDIRFLVRASTDQGLIGEKFQDELYRMAWSGKSKGVAFLSHDERERYWNIAKPVIRDGQKIALVSFQMSLRKHDLFTEETVSQVWLALIVSLLIVLLIISNHVRMFKYAVKAAKLEEVDRMKDDFISMASHELRTPLTAIRGYVELLGDEIPEKNTEASHYLKNVSISVNRLHDLVMDLLEVSRLEQNRLPVKAESVEPSGIIPGIVEELRLNAKEKGLALECEPEMPGKVSADPARLKQILVNLIGNAIKYTEKGSVTVKMKKDDDFYYVTVADTGIGMSAEAAGRLFAKFYRIDTQKTKNITGTGLGLWISREIARKMGGDISVESIEGVGSHFTLKLKMAK